MSKYVCQICGYVYDEDENVPFNSLPEDWKCPLCGAPKAMFVKQEQKTEPVAKSPIKEHENQAENSDARELSSGELAAICSNLARGCEKQYKPEQAALFSNLAQYYTQRASAPESSSFDMLLDSANSDLSNIYLSANQAAAEENDRGAKRVLVWSEKVTRILTAVLERYKTDGASVLEKTKIWVCDICGFVFIGEASPAICPVCKVPGFKILEVK